jgi:hypothetical protein
MRLSSILRQAKSGELSDIAVKDDDQTIIDYINLGMIALYSRFPLKVEEAIIALEDGKTLYKLDGSDMSVAVGGLPIEEDTVLAILEAFDEKGKIEINDESCQMSIFTVNYNTIQVPVVGDNNFISLIFQAAPEEIVYEDDGEGNAEDLDVALPKQLLEPLLHYIGYRAHGAMNGSVEAENNTHLMRYDAACKRAEMLGLIPSDSYEMNISRGGFIV